MFLNALNQLLKLMSPSPHRLLKHTSRSFPTISTPRFCNSIMYNSDIGPYIVPLILMTSTGFYIQVVFHGKNGGGVGRWITHTPGSRQEKELVEHALLGVFGKGY